MGPAQSADDEGVSFYKDALGIVHLQGNAHATGGAVTGTIFTLPVGYRPAGNIYFAAYGPATSALIQVKSDGEVDVFGGSQYYVGLSNITFRAGL